MQIFNANRYVVADLREQAGPIARRAPEIRAVLVREVLRALLPALLALPQAPYVQGRKLLVSLRSLRSASAWWAKPEITWVPEHIRTIFSASGWLAPATGLFP